MVDTKVPFDEMLVRRNGAAPLPTAIVHPCSEDALAGAFEAARAGQTARIAWAILVGGETYRAAA